MDKKIGIIGSNNVGKVVQIISDEKDLIIVDDKPRYSDYEQQVFKIINKEHALTSVFNKKEFVCKGRHEYREVQTKEGSFIKSEWICQCGRKLSD